MTESPKLKLGIKTPSDATAKPADKTRGWNVSAARADKLKELARDMRRNPTEAQALLWEEVKDKKCGGFSFTREVVMGSSIVDFGCRSRWLVVETGGTSEAEVALAELSDRKLTEVGVRVLRFTDDQIMADISSVLAQILAELQKPFEKPGGSARRYQSERPARSASRDDRPGGGYPRGDRSRDDRPRGDRPEGDRRGSGRRDGGGDGRRPRQFSR